ncbi:Uma2 family endonuclease [Hydrogenobacter hydrogenophilus]|uniref:Endonuclease, Uma2 family (Restriction endonuclease fold) n=1 Tax=Hydrogenobacter hydrogenophilus TaxID=35835 RepID=A0A285P6R4_9AQUI|nr:Uma2 family endonuclease [Hydrogenobacter hydrogenophilus]SNZ16853.1 Endonuclease, Uma2 family (restriction endonuclease fold) [Hydrogenobacter hydrogenophilus]
MKTLLEKKRYTIEDYEKLPEGSPYQLIEGELIMSPAPSPEHQEVSINLSYKLYDIVKKTKKGKVLYAPVDVYLDQENAYQPDIVVLLEGSKAKITQRGIEGPPDIVVEILSPSTAYYDLLEKKEVYERSGVKEYWIVDPKRKTFEVYANSQEGFKLLSKAKGEGMVRSELLGVDLDLKEVFE